MRLITIIITILLLFAISCNQQIQNNNQDSEDSQPKENLKQDYKTDLQENNDPDVVGTWRPHAQSIEYDAGAINSIKKPVTRKLTISSDGTWEYGSTGTWEVELIEEKDWERWKMASYGPTKKIVLHGWNNAIGDGPIDEGTAGVDFIWAIYHSDKLSLGPATIQIKFGH